MKFFVLTVYLFICSALAFGQIANDEDAFFNYSYDKALIKRNKVQTVTIQTGFSDGKSAGKHIYEFDKVGLLNKQSIYDSGGNLKREIHFKTNSQHDLHSMIQNDFEYNRVDTIRYFKSYKGNQLIRDSSSRMPIVHYYEYSPHGERLKTVITANLGLGNNMKRVIINKLDSLNRIVIVWQPSFIMMKWSGRYFPTRTFSTV